MRRRSVASSDPFTDTVPDLAMTTLVLALDPETKRFAREDGPCVVHAGESVKLVLQGLGVHAETANANPADE